MRGESEEGRREWELYGTGSTASERIWNEQRTYWVCVDRFIYDAKPTQSRRYLGGALLEGGSDTTSAFLQSVVLMLVAFPEVQRKAQEEVDRVIGSERPPTLEDWVNLPYLQVSISPFCPRASK